MEDVGLVASLIEYLLRMLSGAMEPAVGLMKYSKTSNLEVQMCRLWAMLNIWGLEGRMAREC